MARLIQKIKESSPRGPGGSIPIKCNKPMKAVFLSLVISFLTPSFLNAALLASDDFSTYDETTPGGFGSPQVAGDLGGQDGDNGGGDPLGFSGTVWEDVQAGNSQLIRRIRVNGGVTDSHNGNTSGGTKFYRRSLDSTLADGGDLDNTNDVVWVRVNMAGGTDSGAFNAFVLSETAGGNDNSLRFNASSVFTIDFVTTSGQNPGAVDSASMGVNDGLSHEWLVKIDFAAGSGEAWVDADLNAFDGTGGAGFTLPTAFDALNYVRLQAAGPDNIIKVDDFQIGRTAEDVGAIIVSGNPQITSFTRVSGDTWEVTLEGASNTGYEFYSSTDLTFSPGTLIETLAQGDEINDPGTVTDSNLLTTDSEGNGKVRMTLTGDPSDFVRAETAS